jgi:hypothetical protein
MSNSKRKISSRNTSGFTGVSKDKKRFMARIRIDGKQIHLGTFDSPKEAALAFDRAAVQQKLPSSKLNYPDGLPLDDEDYEELMNPKKKRRLRSSNTTGYNGVSKCGRFYIAQMYLKGKVTGLGAYDTSKEAALAYDRAVVHHKLSSSKLNYPDGLPLDDEDYEALMNPKKKRRLSSANTVGYRGVTKNGKRFAAKIGVESKNNYLGTYDTAKEAALAYDRAVVHHKLSSSKLNFPNGTTSSEDNESSKEENDNDNDDKRDEEEALAFPPLPSSTTLFEMGSNGST